MALNDNGSGTLATGFTLGSNFATTSARDTHFSTNSTAPYDANPFHFITITVGTTVTYQRRQGNAWVDVTGIVQVTGATGGKGDKGDTGDTGNTGETGDTGDKGDIGDTGDKGDIGNTGGKGDTGDTGDTGSKGDTGDTGDKGDTGDTGDKGDTGDTPPARVVSLNYLASGTVVEDKFTYTETSDADTTITFHDSIEDDLPGSYLDYLDDEYIIALVGETSGALRVLQSSTAPALASNIWTLAFIETAIRTNNTAFTTDEDVTIIFEVGTVITKSKIYPHIKNILVAGTNVTLQKNDTTETVTVSSVLDRSWTEIESQSDLDDISVTNAVAFAVVNTDFGDYEVGDVLFYDDDEWVIFIDQSELSRGRTGYKGRPAVNRTVTKAVTTGDTPTDSQVVINSDNIILNVTASDLDSDRLENLPEQTPIYIQIADGTVFRQFGVSNVDVDDDYATISFTDVEHAKGTFNTNHSVTISFGDFLDSGDVSSSLPSGGTTGQVLAKKSSSDSDVEWIDETGGSGTTDLAIGTHDGNSIEIESSTGSNVDIPSATTSAAGLMSDDDKTKLNGISNDAEANVQSDWDATSGDSQILNKPGDASTTAAGLMSAADKTKLDGISANELIPSGGTDGQVLAKSSATDYEVEWTDVATSSGTTNLSIANRDADSLDIASSSGTDATIESASTTEAGLLSAADKTKLNGVATGADVNVQSDWTQTTDTEDDFIKNKPTIITAAQTTKLAGIATAAEVNVQSDWNQATSTADDFVKNKPTTITAVQTTKLAGIAAAAEVNVQSDWTQTTTTADDYIKNKPAVAAGATTSAAGLMSSADKTKLDDIDTSADANIQSDWNQATDTEDDFIKNKPTAQLIPTGGTTGQILSKDSADNYDVAWVSASAVGGDTDLTVANRGTTTLQIASSNGENATVPAATTTAAGLMTSVDKTKLNGIATGAQVNVDTDLAIDNRDSDSIDITSSTGDDVTLPAATTSLAGLMASADKTKLDAISTSAEENVDTDLSIGDRTTHTIEIESSTGDDVTLPAATTTLAGVMSSTDKTKLDSLPVSSEMNVQADWTESDTSDDAYIKNKPTTITAGQTTKLAGIATAAEVNVQSDWAQATTTADDFIKNKPGDATTSAAGFMSGADKTKLNAIATNRQIPSGGTDGQVLAKDSNTNYDVTWADAATASGATNLSVANRDGDSLDIASSTGTDATIASASATEAGLLSAADKTKLNGIAAGADVNVQSDWAQSTSTADDFIKNKPTIITAAQTTKLAGIATAAEVNVQSDWTQSTATADDYIKNKPTTITSTQTSKLAGIATGADVNVDTDLSVGTTTSHTLNIDSSTGDDVTIPSVTTSAAGLMNSDDKTKLNGVATGADVNVQSDWGQTTNTADDFIKNKPTTITAGQTTKLAGIAAAAEVNVQSDWAQATTTADDFIKNKPTTRLIPSGGTDGQVLSKDSNSDYDVTWVAAATGSGTTNLSLDNKDGDSLDIVSSSGTNVTVPSASTTEAGLLSAVDKTKLNGIATGAQVNVDTDLAIDNRDSDSIDITSSTGDDVSIPSATTSLAGLMSGSDKTKLNGIDTGAEANVDTDLAIGAKTTHTIEIESSTGDDVTLPAATASLAGVMSSTDKTKLDGIATDADVNVQSDWSETTDTDDSFIKNKPTTITVAQTAKLAGIATAAEVNVQSDWTQATSTADDFIKNKPGDATTSAAGFMSGADKTKLDALATNRQLPSGGTDGQVLAKDSNSDYDVTWTAAATGSGTTNLGTDNRDNDSIDITSSSGTDVTLPASTTTAAGLMTGTDKTKLNGIATGAQVNVDTDLAIDNRDSDSIDITSSTGDDVTLPSATTSLAGLMASADKTKLNGIATGADVNVKSNWSESDTESDAYIRNKPAIGLFVPTGGADGQVLSKASGTNYDTEWIDAASGGGGGGGGTTNLSIANRDGDSLDIASSTGTDATIASATTTAAGLMSADDKTKLNSIDTDSVQSDWAQSTTTANDFIKNKPPTLSNAQVGQASNTVIGLVSGSLLAHAVETHGDALTGTPGALNQRIESVTFAAYTTTVEGQATNNFLTPITTDPIQNVFGGGTTEMISLSDRTVSNENNGRYFTIAKAGVYGMSWYGKLDISQGEPTAHLDVIQQGKLFTVGEPVLGSTTVEYIPYTAADQYFFTNGLFFVPADDTEVRFRISNANTTFGINQQPRFTVDANSVLKIMRLTDQTVTDLAIDEHGVSTLDITSSTGTDITIPAATTTETGLMSAADKTKLDGIAANELIPTGGTDGQVLAKASGTNYDTEWIDAASGGGGGGTTNLSIANRDADSLDIASSTGTDATIASASTTEAGLLSAADKTKLNGIDTGAEANVPTNLISNTSAGQVIIGSSTGINATYIICYNIFGWCNECC